MPVDSPGWPWPGGGGAQQHVPQEPVRLQAERELREGGDGGGEAPRGGGLDGAQLAGEDQLAKEGDAEAPHRDAVPRQQGQVEVRRAGRMAQWLVMVANRNHITVLNSGYKLKKNYNNIIIEYIAIMRVCVCVYMRA